MRQQHSDIMYDRDSGQANTTHAICDMVDMFILLKPGFKVLITTNTQLLNCY